MKIDPRAYLFTVTITLTLVKCEIIDTLCCSRCLHFLWSPIVVHNADSFTFIYRGFKISISEISASIPNFGSSKPWKILFSRQYKWLRMQTGEASTWSDVFSMNHEEIINICVMCLLFAQNCCKACTAVSKGLAY